MSPCRTEHTARDWRSQYNDQQSLSRYNKTHLAVRTELPHLDVVNEGDVVGGVPVQAVAVHGEGDGVQQCVDGRDNFLAILSSRAVLDGQAPADEIILNIHHHQGTAGSGHFLDPLGPAEHELLLAHLPAPAHIEDLEQLLQLRRLQPGVVKYLVFCMIQLFTTPLLTLATAISYFIFGRIDNYNNIPVSQQ